MKATQEQMIQAFQAIDEEASKLLGNDLSEPLKQGLHRIVKIARHRKDTRRSKPGSCTSDKAK
jgi:hypothetical protein